MNTKPLISLIVPCYNAANLCDRFFSSLLEQTYTNIQLILINDGSTDNTEEKLFSYKEQLEDKGYVFDYIYQDNKGLGGAINTGLKKVKGDFICWADLDDYFEKDAFEIRLKYFADHPDCMVLTCDAAIRDSSDISKVIGRESDSISGHNEPKQFQLLIDYKSMFCPGTHMIRTSAFKKANPQMDIYEGKRGQNWQLLLPMYYFYDRHTLPNVVYNYIIYESSMSHSDNSYSKKKKRIDESETIILETLKRIDMPETEREKYNAHVKNFHKKLKMYNARAHSDKELYFNYYKELKKDKALDFKDRLRKIRFILSGR